MVLLHVGAPLVKKEIMMQRFLQLGEVSIELTDTEFAQGFQVGYLHYQKDFEEKPLTDTLIAEVCMQNMIDVKHVNRHNAGYLLGWFTRLLACQPQQQDTRPPLQLLPFQPTQGGE